MSVSRFSSRATSAPPTFPGRNNKWPLASSNCFWCMRSSLSSTSACRNKPLTAFSSAAAPMPLPPVEATAKPLAWLSNCCWCSFNASASLVTKSIKANTLASNCFASSASAAEHPPNLLAFGDPGAALINSSRTAFVAASENSTRSVVCWICSQRRACSACKAFLRSAMATSPATALSNTSDTFAASPSSPSFGCAAAPPLDTCCFDNSSWSMRNLSRRSSMRLLLRSMSFCKSAVAFSACVCF
mmetsp:Transcript_15182/g.43869  ORF Transcript_15182/g.43869 Transcript_15182/m.43869 type:complete len:244 (-) Transcript_15182:1653-2384(-)